MTKSELDTLLKTLGIDVNEGESAEGTVFPRINYWEYGWSFLSASGAVYGCVVTYQISFFSQTPRHAKLIALIQALEAYGPLPQVSHEWVTQPTPMVHSFFSLDVIEDLI